MARGQFTLRWSPYRLPFRGRCACYPHRIGKSQKFDLDNPAPVVNDEDEETSPPLTKECGTLRLVEP